MKTKKTKHKLLIGLGIIFFILIAIFINEWFVVKRVAIIPIKGEITSMGCGGSLLFGVPACASVSEIKTMIEDAESDRSVKAIILDIDSPGGGVVPSRNLMRAVKKCEKPVVALIGDEGASGAYYVASASDKIVADRNSMVGGIGVRVVIPSYEGLFRKLGIHMTVIKAGENKDIGSPYRNMTKEEKEKIQRMVDQIYEDFVYDIAENRNLENSDVMNIATGDLYLGKDAKELKLVDYLGGEDKAIEIAAELAGISGEPQIIYAG